MPYSYPESAATPDCAIVLVPIELVPIVGALFSQLEQRKRWITDEDWEQGYKAFADLQDQLMNNCLKAIIDELRALRGVRPEYTSVPIEERTSEMYNSFNEIIPILNYTLVALRGVEPIDDSIIQALRGETEASATRNVADLLE